MLNRMNARSRLVWAPPLLLAACAVASAEVPTQLLFRSGDPVPEVAGGGVIDRVIREPAVSSSDAMAVGVVAVAQSESGQEFTDVLLRRLPGTGVFKPVLWTGLPGPRPDTTFLQFSYLPDPNAGFARYIPINANGDMAFIAVMNDEARNDLTEERVVPAAFRLPSVGSVEEVWQFGRPIEGLEEVEFARGALPLSLDDQGVVRTPLVFNDFETALLTLDDEGPFLGPRSFSDGIDTFTEFATEVNGAGSVLAYNPDSRPYFIVADAQSDTPRFIIDSEGLHVEGTRRVVRSIRGHSLAPDGTVAFAAFTEHESDGSRSSDLWSVSPGGEPVVKLSLRDLVPGIDGPLFGGIFNTFAASEGTIFFDLGIFAPEVQPLPPGINGVWVTDAAGGFEFVVGPGGTAPGTDGAEFTSVQDFSFGASTSVLVNARGDAIFLGTLALDVGDTTRANDRGIWAWDAGVRELRLLVRDGDQVDVSRPGEAPDLRTIAFIRLNPDTGFADNGRIGYALIFTDGSEAAFTTFVGENAWACTADFNADGVIDMGDFGVFASAFDSEPGDASYDARADLSGDHDVDLGDFGLFAQRFGRDDCPR